MASKPKSSVWLFAKETASIPADFRTAIFFASLLKWNTFGGQAAVGLDIREDTFQVAQTPIEQYEEGGEHCPTGIQADAAEGRR